MLVPKRLYETVAGEAPEPTCREPEVKRFDADAVPCTSKRVVGTFVPIPTLPVVEFTKNMFDPTSKLPPTEAVPEIDAAPTSSNATSGTFAVPIPKDVPKYPLRQRVVGSPMS